VNTQDIFKRMKRKKRYIELGNIETIRIILKEKEVNNETTEY
jgi:hypothetical protein